MSDEIRFEIPEHIAEEDFADYIANNSDEYYGAFDQTANEHDDRSSVDGINVINVELTEDEVHIEYEVDYSAYHGCRDKNYADTDERELFGTRNGRVITFDKFVFPQKRSTFDEF